MDWFFGAAIYFVTWWIVLFAILPLGVRTQWDDETVEPGTADSAPTAPRLLMKAILTTIIATLVFALIWSILTYQWIGLDDIPFLPRYERV